MLFRSPSLLNTISVPCSDTPLAITSARPPPSPSLPFSIPLHSRITKEDKATGSSRSQGIHREDASLSLLPRSRSSPLSLAFPRSARIDVTFRAIPAAPRAWECLDFTPRSTFVSLRAPERCGAAPLLSSSAGTTCPSTSEAGHYPAHQSSFVPQPLPACSLRPTSPHAVQIDHSARRSPPVAS